MLLHWASHVALPRLLHRTPRREARSCGPPQGLVPPIDLPRQKVAARKVTHVGLALRPKPLSRPFITSTSATAGRHDVRSTQTCDELPVAWRAAARRRHRATRNRSASSWSRLTETQIWSVCPDNPLSRRLLRPSRPSRCRKSSCWSKVWLYGQERDNRQGAE